MDPFRALLRRVPPGDKTFSKFQKGLSPPVNLKPPEPFPTPIKWKEYQLDPLGAAFAASLRGIKHFQDFKKASHPPVNLKPPEPFPTPIKWKEY